MSYVIVLLMFFSVLYQGYFLAVEESMPILLLEIVLWVTGMIGFFFIWFKE